MIEKTEWNNYKKGEANCYSWKLERVQVKITDNHFINNFVDFINEDKSILYDIDKIILLGSNYPIALYPPNSEDINNIIVYLDSIKNTDIHTVVLSLGENSGIFVNSDLIEDTLAALNAHTKIEVRYILND